MERISVKLPKIPGDDADMPKLKEEQNSKYEKEKKRLDLFEVEYKISNKYC